MLADFFVAVIELSDAYKRILPAFMLALQQTQKGRLALARSPNDGENFSGGELEFNARKQLFFTGKDIQVFNFDVKSERQVFASELALRIAHGAAREANHSAFFQLNQSA